MSPVAGFTRNRRHLFGRQPTHGTKVPATRAYPLSGVPSHDPQWTDVEVDAGSIDIVAAPVRGAGEYTAGLNDNGLRYNTLPLLLCGFFGGGVNPTGGGTAQTWIHEPSSTDPDEPDEFTYEFGDDVLDDWFQYGDGIIESVEFTAPEGLGPLTASTNWRFGSIANTGSTDAPADVGVPQDLVIVPNEAIVYLKDMKINIADTVATLAANQVVDALHSFVMRWNREVDQKRFANGSQKFDISAYGPGARTIEVEATWAKTDDIVGLGSEADKWLSDEAVDRYIQLVFVSTVLAEAPSTFYGWTVTLPARYYTRVEDALGGNSTVVLMARAFYDPDDLGHVFRSVLVCTVDETDIGEVGS